MVNTAALVLAGASVASLIFAVPPATQRSPSPVFAVPPTSSRARNPFFASPLKFKKGPIAFACKYVERWVPLQKQRRTRESGMPQHLSNDIQPSDSRDGGEVKRHAFENLKITDKHEELISTTAIQAPPLPAPPGPDMPAPPQLALPAPETVFMLAAPSALPETIIDSASLAPAVAVANAMHLKGRVVGGRVVISKKMPAKQPVIAKKRNRPAAAELGDLAA